MTYFFCKLKNFQDAVSNKNNNEISIYNIFLFI